MSRQRISLRTEAPLLVWLVLVWGALWQDFSLGTLVFGAVVALVVVHTFYLPPVQLGGRFNVVQMLIAVLEFLRELAIASFHVFAIAVFRGRTVRSSLIAVPLRTHSDLIITATASVTGLVPGSVVVEVDRAGSTLYLHCLDVSTPADADRVRETVRGTEARLIKMMGSREELERLGTAERARIGGTA
ncbi:Na+/H+ antiporter subunit E [Tersicoccus sp. Bi-70]|uniref:Na+/H+ antiporter subunit E n=1 Tax=Tersicoccus sp. Bi-70 TaxID=1897634 RepID=UPI0009775DFB|nr:Na+/H+ antiporter subunit E [Tersicoccus sp. Bi-70]OMH34355.1 Na+/H+ antiporter subunit E [Tersicoccus sp. Bi-70]